MGFFLNPSTRGFQSSLNSEIYVDKTGLIARTNARINTQQRFLCVSRPRRFGKSMAMDMLAAYYSCGQDSRYLFEGLSIASDPSFEEHLDQYNVIKINLPHFLGMTQGIDELLELLQRELVEELREAYGTEKSRLFLAMQDVFCKTGRPFVILIDEWDCLFREYRDDNSSQEKYLSFLRAWLKDQEYVALAYMTGILPVKKYGTHSALNMFTEYSMTSPRDLAPFFGFTEDEVRQLCAERRMSFDEAKAWYDGYELTELNVDGNIVHSMYNPKSIVEAMLSRSFDTYWNQTETYEALKAYIQLNMDGLKDAVTAMLSGFSVPVDISGFANDMTTFFCADDVLTLLVHLGYLSYRADRRAVTIPNKEVAQVYITSIMRTPSFSEVARSINASQKLLEDLWNGNAPAVAAGIDQAHDEISILKYNDENSLACTVQLAFYAAREYYSVVRELPAGKGFADICLIPRPWHMDKPAVLIELKRDLSASGAIDQIRRKRYPDSLRDLHSQLLLVGINYDKVTKKHECLIERFQTA